MREAFEALAIGEDEWTPAREAERITEEAWAQYVPAFIAEMRASYRANRAAWDRLLGRDRVVLACYCSDQRCHRVLLARDILPRLGAVYRGELEEPKERGLFDAPRVAAGGR